MRTVLTRHRRLAVAALAGALAGAWSPAAGAATYDIAIGVTSPVLDSAGRVEVRLSCSARTERSRCRGRLTLVGRAGAVAGAAIGARDYSVPRGRSRGVLVIVTARRGPRPRASANSRSRRAPAGRAKTGRAS
jgi:hypothetical protein